jgi:hypothetical protein
MVCWFVLVDRTEKLLKSVLLHNVPVSATFPDTANVHFFESIRYWAGAVTSDFCGDEK